MPSLLLTVDLVDYQGNQVDKIQDVLVVVVLRVELIDHRTTQVLLIRQGTGKVRPKHSCMPTSVMIFNYCCGLLASKLVNLDVNRCMVKSNICLIMILTDLCWTLKLGFLTYVNRFFVKTGKSY